jgi:hypothetical protein
MDLLTATTRKSVSVAVPEDFLSYEDLSEFVFSILFGMVGKERFKILPGIRVISSKGLESAWVLEHVGLVEAAGDFE